MGMMTKTTPLKRAANTEGLLRTLGRIEDMTSVMALQKAKASPLRKQAQTPRLRVK